jgi:hypothetical protein
MYYIVLSQSSPSYQFYVVFVQVLLVVCRFRRQKCTDTFQYFMCSSVFINSFSHLTHCAFI